MDITIGLTIALAISLIVNLKLYWREPTVIEYTPEPDPDSLLQTRKALGRIANRRVAIMEHHYHDDKDKRHSWVAHKLRLYDPSLTDNEIDNYIKHGIIKVRGERG